MGAASRRKGERRAQASEPRTGFAITDRQRVTLARFFADFMPRDANDREKRIALKRALRVDDRHASVFRHPQNGQVHVALGVTKDDGKFEIVRDEDRVPRLHDLSKVQAEFLLEKISKAAVPDEIEESLFELSEGLRRLSIGTYVPPASAREVEDVATLTEDPPDDEAEPGEGDGEP